MFLTLLACGIMLLAAFLGNLKKLKHKRVYIIVLTIFCGVVLILAFITENPFDDKKNRPYMQIINNNNYINYYNFSEEFNSQRVKYNKFGESLKKIRIINETEITWDDNNTVHYKQTTEVIYE